MKNKHFRIGMILGVLSPILCCIIILFARFPEYMSFEYLVNLWLGNDKTALPIIKASMLINLPIFLISLNKFKNQKFASGTVTGTLIIGAYIFIIYFFK